MKPRNFTPSPTGVKVLNDWNKIIGIRGPVGSGKSSLCVMKLFQIAKNQPVNGDGIRHSRMLVVRDTYPNLDSTTIKTWKFWFPEEIYPVSSAYPRESTVKMKLEDGSILKMEVVFLAAESEDTMDKLQSNEFTAGWINEAGAINNEILWNVAFSRLCRLPAKQSGGSELSKILLMDLNSPAMGHWTQKLEHAVMVEKAMPKASWYVQPPAMTYQHVVDDKGNEKLEWTPNPDAENVDNHNGGFAYYQDLVDTSKESWLKVMVANEFGQINTGRPVYPGFSQYTHVSKDALNPDRSVNLLVGMDFGLNVAMAICQMMPSGQLRIIHEEYEEDCSLENFIETKMIPLFSSRRFSVCGRPTIIGDPTGVNRSSIDKRNPYNVLSQAGFHAVASHTNEIVARRDAVLDQMKRIGGLLIDPNCKTIIEGMSGAYQYDTGGLPKKDKFSHLQDGVQNVALYVRKGSSKQKKIPVKPAKKFYYG
jgi:hypothetical protein